MEEEEVQEKDTQGAEEETQKPKQHNSWPIPRRYPPFRTPELPPGKPGDDILPGIGYPHDWSGL